MDAPSARILVVANQEDAAELAGMLEGQVTTADGGDDTVTRFVAEHPEVVVVAATLDAGDARSLIGALRGAAPTGSFQVILIGDAKGPIRNALDAADFTADRFVARPVALKALRYAVNASVTAARRARGDGAADVTAAPEAVVPERASTRLTGTHRAVMITPPSIPAVVVDAEEPGRGEPLPVPAHSTGRATTLAERIDAMLDAAVEDEAAAEIVRHTSGGFAVPLEAILAAGGSMEEQITAPMTVHEVPTRPMEPVTIQPRRREAEPPPPAEPSKRAASVPPPPPVRVRAARASEPPIPVDDDDILESGEPAIEVGAESGSYRLPPDLDTPLVEGTHGSFDPAPTPVPTGDAADAWDADAPAMPVREPTMILSEPAAAAAAAAPPPVIVRVESEPGAEPESPEELDPLEDLGDLSASRPVVPEDLPPTGGDFARELRRKMSAMAQRLFRGADAAPPAVDTRPPHDYRTEIDLSSIDAGDGGAAAAAVYDLQTDATFSGDDHGLPTSVGHIGADHGTGGGTSGTASARTSESGEISRGTSDAAVLIARMFTSEFTGKVTFRRGVHEKVIYFDGGRPVFASSNLSEDRMGELLFREGKITAEQYAGVASIVSESGRRMGEILVDRGYLKRRELLPAVRRHVEDIIYSLFAWDQGEYRIAPGDGASSERIRLSRHPAAMVLEGVRRKLDQRTLERLLGPASTLVEVGDRDKAGTVIAVADLSQDERAALAAMDGSADLGHIARTIDAPLVTIYQLAWALTLLGVATVRRRGGDDDDQPALVGETDLAIDRERVRARHRLVGEADYFALLGVRRDATGFEIRRAYEGSRRDFDADSFPPELRAELGLELAEIGAVLDEAYRVLRDDRLRAEYLAHLAAW